MPLDFYISGTHFIVDDAVESEIEAQIMRFKPITNHLSTAAIIQKSSITIFSIAV